MAFKGSKRNSKTSKSSRKAKKCNNKVCVQAPIRINSAAQANKAKAPKQVAQVPATVPIPVQKRDSAISLATTQKIDEIAPVLPELTEATRHQGITQEKKTMPNGFARKSTEFIPKPCALSNVSLAFPRSFADAVKGKPTNVGKYAPKLNEMDTNQQVIMIIYQL